MAHCSPRECNVMSLHQLALRSGRRVYSNSTRRIWMGAANKLMKGLPPADVVAPSVNSDNRTNLLSQLQIHRHNGERSWRDQIITTNASGEHRAILNRCPAVRRNPTEKRSSFLLRKSGRWANDQPTADDPKMTGSKCPKGNKCYAFISIIL